MAIVQTRQSKLTSSPLAPKRHHFVPEMLQKRFVDEDGWLHAFSTRRADKQVYRVRPEKLFFENHLYSGIGEDGSRLVETERMLSQLESLADPVIEKIVRAAREGIRPGLTSLELDVWYYFLVMQWKRVPDLHLTVTPDQEVHDTLDGLIADLRQGRPQFSEALDDLASPEGRARMVKNARVGVLQSVSDQVIVALRSRGLAIGTIKRPDKRFALASRPVVKLTLPGKTHIRHPECEMWLPVASDVVVGLGRGRGTVTMCTVSPDQVRNLNLGAVGQSSVFASASSVLTLSLARRR